MKEKESSESFHFNKCVNAYKKIKTLKLNNTNNFNNEDFNSNFQNNLNNKIRIVPTIPYKKNELNSQNYKKITKRYTSISSFLAFNKKTQVQNGKKVNNNTRENNNNNTPNNNIINNASISNISISGLLKTDKEEIPKEKKLDIIKTHTHKNSIEEENLKNNITKNGLNIVNNNPKNKNEPNYNNFLCKSKSLKNGYYPRLSRQSSKFLNRNCFICDNVEGKLYHTKKCLHFFCTGCGIYFYSLQAKNNIFSLKCPKYDCQNKFQVNEIKEILPKITYEKFIKKSLEEVNEDIDEIKEIPEVNEETQNRKLKDLGAATFLHKLTFLKNSGDLKNKNILKIENQDKFRKTVRKVYELKNIICVECGKPALFTKKDEAYIRCLNCGDLTCKFCHKKYNFWHLSKGFESSCKIYNRYSVQIGKPLGMKYFYFYLAQLLGIFIILIGFSKIEAEYLSGYKKNKNKCFRLVIIIFILTINCFLLIILLPYYPILINIIK